MPELEQVAGIRVVARPDALDRATWNPDDVTVVWRMAPDEAFSWRAGSPTRSVQLDDPDAIVELEHGFSVAYLLPDDVDVVQRHCEFAWPEARPAMVQGKVAGVPVKIWLADFPNGDCLLVQTCYAHDLRTRLGW